MKKNFIHRFYPFVILVMVLLVFAYPYLFKSLVPFPSRYLVNHFSPWNAYPDYTLPVKNNATPDVIGQIYPWKKLTIDTWKTGSVPLWNPYSFSGTPHLANYQSQVFSPTNLLYFFLPFIDAWSIQIILQPFLAGIFMYLYMRSIRVSQKGSVISSISFMFCGFITTWMLYGTLAYAVLFLPLALYSIELFNKKPRFIPLAALTFSIVCSFFSGHFQTSIYVFGSILLYIFWNFLYDRNVKSTMYLLVSSVAGLLLSSPQILPSLEFYGQSTRESIYQKVESIPWKYFPTRIAPDFFGNPVTRNDWFGHYAEWNSYAGIIPFILSIFSFLVLKTKHVLFFLILFTISVLLSHESPVIDILVKLHIPVVSTSAASRIIVLSSFAVAALSGIGFDILVQKAQNKKFLILSSAPILFMVSILWMVVIFNIMDPEKTHIARNNLLLPSALVFAYFISVVILSVCKKKNIMNLVGFGIVFLVLFEMLRFAMKWMPFEERKFVYPQIPTVQEFQKLSSPDRFYLDTHAENSIMYHIPIADGYDPLYSDRYGRFIKYVATGAFEKGDRSIVIFPKNGTFTKEAINLMGMKYIAYRNSDGRESWAFPYWKYSPDHLEPVYNDGKYTIFKNNFSVPRSYGVYNTITERDNNKILQKLFSSQFSSSESAIVEKSLGITSVDANPLTEGKIVTYKPNRVEITIDMQKDGLVVLSDAYYPGWNAYIDGVETPIIRTNYTFRGVSASKGHHEIIFSYEPDSFKRGLFFAFFGMMSLGVCKIGIHRYAKAHK